MSKAVLRSEVQDFFYALESAQELEKQEQADKNKLQVSEFVGFVAFAYEKLRNLVDYKDDVLLRKNAIKRLLRQRKVLAPVVTEQALANDLLRELVLSRYLPNNTVPLSRIDQLANILSKYRQLLTELRNQGDLEPNLKKWLLGLEACEIEYMLVIDPLPRILTLYAYRLLQPVFRPATLTVKEQTYNTQLVITLQRLLEKADHDILAYYLFKHRFPTWFKAEEYDLKEVAKALPEAHGLIEKQLHHKLVNRLQLLVRRALVPFTILRVMIREQGSAKVHNFIAHVGETTRVTEETYHRYYKQIRMKIRRKGLHAMAYIFLTKMLLAIFLELPYERYVIGHINYIALSINLIFPPFLMLLITLLITSPLKKNVSRLVMGMKEILYGLPEPLFLKSPPAKRVVPLSWARLGFALLSAATFIASFGLIIAFLQRTEFNVLSGALFIFFVSLVSFFGMSLRQQANSLKVVPAKGNIFTFILDIISLPMVWLGRWLSNTFDKINIFVLFMDFFIELPLKVLLKFLDRWFSFLKEKKEEML
ncbi:MAG: hypothetical protein ABIJ81_00930 [Patescibacteria group bacterium]